VENNICVLTKDVKNHHLDSNTKIAASGDSCEDSLALLKELSEKKDENIKQLLKRKKLSVASAEYDDDNHDNNDDIEDNEKTVNLVLILV